VQEQALVDIWVQDLAGSELASAQASVVDLAGLVEMQELILEQGLVDIWEGDSVALRMQVQVR